MRLLSAIGLVLIISVVVANVKALSDAEKKEIGKKMKAFGHQCHKVHPLTLSDLKKFQKKIMPDGNNPKCFTACMFKKIGFMDDMGMISPKGARELAEQIYGEDEERLKNVDKLMRICSAVNEETTSDGDKGCERAKLAFPCFVENASKYGFDLDF